MLFTVIGADTAKQETDERSNDRSGNQTANAPIPGEKAYPGSEQGKKDQQSEAGSGLLFFMWEMCGHMLLVMMVPVG